MLSKLSPKLEGSDVAVALAVEPPVPESPVLELHNLILLGSLPPRVRSLYDLPWSMGREAVFRASTRALRASRPLSPRTLARGRNAGRFDRVARTEAVRIAAGRPPIRMA